MAKPKYTEITNAVYNLLEYFPADEPLKIKAKEKALAIMENLSLLAIESNPQFDKKKSASQALKDIEVLRAYLDLAKKRGWLENMNLMILLREYDRIKAEIKPLAIEPEKEERIEKAPKIRLAAPVDNNVDKARATSDVAVLSDRQSKILEILQNQEKAQVSDFKKILPEVTKRTIRRDLDELLKMGKIERKGEWNQVVYKLYKIEPVASTNQDGGGTNLMS